METQIVELEGCRTCLMNATQKPSWGEGPWQNEPFRIEWKHAGLNCIAHRGGGGAWCGYVAVPPGHPYHGKHYDDVDVQVHGSLTYAEACNGHICHVPEPGESDDVWWLGFDCNHAGDKAPGSVELDIASSIFLNIFDANDFGYIGHYWTLTEAQEETNKLAEQLAEVTAEVK